MHTRLHYFILFLPVLLSMQPNGVNCKAFTAITEVIIR